MTESANLRNDLPAETAIPGGAGSLDLILRTEELAKRPWRAPDYEKENAALAALVGALADSPRTILQTLAEKVLVILQADSAGLSLLTKDEKRFYWAAIAGAWAAHIGGGTPRDFGPCGDVLDRNVPMLFTHWERRYPYLSAAVPLAEEGLLVPFYVHDKAVGTIWVIAHNDGRKFDAEDLRLLQSMGRFASAAYQAVDALTASIAHEVNQPLSGIITNASTSLRMLAADPPDLNGARATAQRTLRDGKRASEVVQRLRTLFARDQPATEPVDLNDAAREVLTLSSSDLQRNHVILRTDFDQGLPAVRGDRIQLQQVILNLILNAVDAMGTVDDRPRDLLVASACEDASRVRLSVRDAGVGIDPLNVEKLFDAFYTTKSHGMGVGLSISRSIIETHQGRLWASANDGPGATFSFSIPCRCEPAPGPEDAA